MPVDRINGVDLYWEATGSGGPSVVLVHGSWVDHKSWDLVVATLSESFQVFTYDRRGHSSSERRPEPESVAEDVGDLIALVEHFGLAPTHVAGNSFGASIVLKTSIERPDIFQSVFVHEPPLLGLLGGDARHAATLQEVEKRIGTVLKLYESGDVESAAREFVETIAIGPGGWAQLPKSMQETIKFNAPTFYDEARDSGAMSLDIEKLSSLNRPNFSYGDQSPPFFRAIVDKLVSAAPHAKAHRFEGAGHIPHLSHAAEYVETISGILNE